MVFIVLCATMLNIQILYSKQENSYGSEQAVKDDSQVGRVQKLTQSEQSKPENTTGKALLRNVSTAAYNTQEKQCEISIF